MLKSLPRGPVLAGQALVDVALHRRLPETHVGGVDRELLGVLGDLHVGVGQQELAEVRSRVNMLVPWPVVSTIMVDGP
jgi:hypothetical protein